MKRWMLGMALAGVLVGGVSAEDEQPPVRFRVELKPIGGIVSSDLDGLGVRRNGYGEYLDGYSSYQGTAQLGIQINALPCYFDVLVGGGGVGNGGFASGLLVGDIGCRFKLNKAGTLALGPFFGAIVPGDTEWELDEYSSNDDSIDMKGNAGVQGGLKFTGGWTHVSFILAVGYAQYGYDFDTNETGWEITRDSADTWESYSTADKEVDMSGFFGQFGVSVQF